MAVLNKWNKTKTKTVVPSSSLASSIHNKNELNFLEINPLNYKKKKKN